MKSSERPLGPRQLQWLNDLQAFPIRQLVATDHRDFRLLWNLRCRGYLDAPRQSETVFMFYLTKKGQDALKAELVVAGS